MRAGYGVIVPRMRQTLSGAARSRFAALISRSAGVDIYSSLAGEYYQDVYGTGLFGGKGIFNISCFYSALFGKLPDNAILSHDLIEGCYLRAGFAHDITLFDEEPGGIFAVVEAAAPLDTRGLAAFALCHAQNAGCFRRGLL